MTATGWSDAVLIDLDGTLLDTDHIVSDRSRTWKERVESAKAGCEFHTAGGLLPHELPGALRARGYRVYVVTRAVSYYAKSLLRAYGIEHDGLVAWHDYAQELVGAERFRKAHGFAEATRRADLGALESAIVLGNDLADMEGARDVGLRSIRAEWGVASGQKMDGCAPTFVAWRPDDVLSVLAENPPYLGDYGWMSADHPRHVDACLAGEGTPPRRQVLPAHEIERTLFAAPYFTKADTRCGTHPGWSAQIRHFKAIRSAVPIDPQDASASAIVDARTLYSLSYVLFDLVREVVDPRGGDPTRVREEMRALRRTERDHADAESVFRTDKTVEAVHRRLSEVLVVPVPPKPGQTDRFRKLADFMKAEFAGGGPIRWDFGVLRCIADRAKTTRQDRQASTRATFTSAGPVTGHVVLLDDVVTTGATVRTCRDLLLRAGAKRVTAVAFGRTQFPCRPVPGHEVRRPTWLSEEPDPWVLDEDDRGDTREVGVDDCVNMRQWAQELYGPDAADVWANMTGDYPSWGQDD